MLLPLLLPSLALASPPNLVLLVADDLGVMDLTVHGGQNPTPEITALARRGVVMETAYAVSPICSPSRAGLLTGRYPQRFGFSLITHTRYARDPLSRLGAELFLTGDGWELAPRQPLPGRAEVARQGLPSGEPTLAEILGGAGYRTAMAGKWHLGLSPEQDPRQRGFEHFYGFLEAYSLYADPRAEEIVNLRLDHFADRHQWRTERQGPSAIQRDGVILDERRYLTDAIAEELVADIQLYKDEPFFLYGAFNAPHTPYQAPVDSLDPAQPDPGRRVYEAMVRGLDQAVGRVVDALEVAGVADNTLILLTSDNGAAAYTHVASNLPYDGGKLTHLEGGIRVPMIAVWPGHLPAGQRYAPPVSLLDVLPTLCAAGGVALQADRPIDGVDLAPYLRGERAGVPHEDLYWSALGSRAIRAGDYKLILDSVTRQVALYDLATDPYERQDLAPTQPERVERMRAQLAAWEAQMPPAAWPPVMQYRYTDGVHTWVFPL